MHKNIRLLTLGLQSLFFLFSVNAVGAVEKSASDTVAQTVEKVKVVVERESEGLSSEQVETELRDLLRPVFDFREMARRSLGANWKKGTPEQQAEFVDLFSDLLAKNYLKKIRENIRKGTFAVAGESEKGKKSLVKTTFTIDGEVFKIDYRLRQKKNRWMAYDVIIENIGLVTNYRNEFAGIIRKEKFDGLLVKLRAKK